MKLWFKRSLVVSVAVLTSFTALAQVGAQWNSTRNKANALNPITVPNFSPNPEWMRDIIEEPDAKPVQAPELIPFSEDTVEDLLGNHKTSKTANFGFNRHSDKIYFSLAPDVQVLGPVLGIHAKTDKTEVQTYISWLFRELIRTADELIRDQGEFGYNSESNYNYSYFSFLVLAMAVPHHESGLMHFRANEGNECSVKANEFTASKSPRTKKVMIERYRDAATPLMPDCRFLKGIPSVTQLLNSNNFDDVGVMQINPGYHPSALEPAVLLKAKEFISYGLKYLFSGYMKVRSDLAKSADYYHCSMTYDPYKIPGKTKPMIFFNSLRATWASKYNSGNPKEICRFVESNEYDDAFAKTLRSIVVGNTSIFHQYLPEGSLERNAFQEILNNYKRIFITNSDAEESQNLKILLNMPEKRHQNWVEPARLKIEPTHTLKASAGMVTVYRSPKLSLEMSCGYLDTRVSSSGIVIREENSGRLNPEEPNQEWSLVRVPKYASYAYVYSPHLEVGLRSGKSVVNLREHAGDTSVAPVGQLRGNQRMDYLGEEIIGKTKWLKMSMVIPAKADQPQTEQVVYAHGDYVQVYEGQLPAKAECQTDTYYVLSEDLQHLPIEYVPGKAYIGEINGKGSLRFRQGPGINFEEVGLVSAGEKVTVIGDDSKESKSKIPTWYQVILANGEQGYVYAPRVDIIKLQASGQ